MTPINGYYHWRGNDLSQLLQPSYDKFGREVVNAELNRQLELLGVFFEGQAGFHNMIDSDMTAPVGGYSFIKARRKVK